jgi:hypothetical protein
MIFNHQWAKLLVKISPIFTTRSSYEPLGWRLKSSPTTLFKLVGDFVQTSGENAVGENQFYSSAPIPYCFLTQAISPPT